MNENGKENKAFDALEQSDDIQSSPVKNEEDNIQQEESTSSDVEASLDVESNGVVQSEDSNIDTSPTADENDTANEEEKEKKANQLKSKLETFRTDHFSVCGKQKTCNNIHWFVVVYSIILVSRSCIGSYIYTVAHEIWKRYYLSTYEFNFIIGVEKIGFIITLIFSSFYGNKFVKPISILVGSILCGIGAIMCSIPYFILGHREIDTLQTLPSYVEAGLCLHSTVVKNVTYTDQCNQHPAIIAPNNENAGAYSLLCSGHFFIGVGTAFLIPAGIVYIDEAEKPDYMAFFLGIIISSYGVGSLLGSLFGYWFVTIPEGLSGQILVSKWHVGAWWIGLTLFGIILILSSIALIIFPKWIREPKWLLYRKYRAHLRLERWKKREQEARRRRRQRKREKLRKERERRNIKAKNMTSKGSDEERPSDTNTSADDGAMETANNQVAVGGENKMDDTETKDSSIKTDVDANQSEDNNLSKSDKETGTEKDENDELSENKIENNETSDKESNDAKNKNSNADSQKQRKESVSKISNVKTNGTIDQNRRYRRRSPSKVRTDKTSSIEIAENDTDVETDNKKKSADEKNKIRHRLGRKLEDLPKYLWFLLTRPLFLVTTFAASLSLYLQAGYFQTMSIYFQRQFQYAEHSAGLIPCAVYGIAIVIGCMTSGIVIHKLKLALKSQLKMCMICQAGVIIGLLVLMALGCNLQQSPLNVNSKGAIYSTCASECDCSLSQQHRVCDKTATVSYASPCHAGCKEATVDQESKIVQYESCNCVPGGELAAEWCETQCTLAVVYVLILLVVVALQASAYITVVLLMLRSLPEKLRSITLGFSWWIIYLIAFVPGVGIYNQFFYLSCTISSENCKEESECWAYDSPLYRYATHGATIAFIVVGLVLFIVSYVIFIKTKSPGISQTSETNKNKNLESNKDKAKLKYVKENGASNEANGVQNKAFSRESAKEVSSV